MVLSKTILILEDNLKVLARILDRLFELEQDQEYDLSVIVLTNHQQVEDYVNNNPKAQFDIILLDRDCKLNNSFHVLNIERFGADKIIAISSVPEYNKETQRRGVKRVVLKDLQFIDEFANKVVKEVERMISPSRLFHFSKRGLGVKQLG
jgi:c-di-GMP-binding flagellar brake protein YcgR